MKFAEASEVIPVGNCEVHTFGVSGGIAGAMDWNIGEQIGRIQKEFDVLRMLWNGWEQIGRILKEFDVLRTVSAD